MNRSIFGWLALAFTACQSYSTVNVSAVPVGSVAQVALTDSGSRFVVPLVGSRAELLEGRVSSSDATGLTMNVSELTRSGGATELAEGRVVQLPAALISSVKVQSLNVGRTVLLGGAMVAGSVLAGRSLGRGSGSTLRGGGPIVNGQ